MNIQKGDGSDEREFLHDLSSPVGTAMLLADSFLDDLQNRLEVPPDDLMRLGEIFQALEKIKNLLISRREILVKRGVPSART